MPVNKSANAALAKDAAGYGKLSLTVNGKAVEIGQYVPRAGMLPRTIMNVGLVLTTGAEAQSPPAIAYPEAKGGPYLTVALDMDAPFPSFTVLGPILHWIQPGFKPGSSGLEAEGTPFVVDFIGPAPPPGSGPHRYCFFLYEQPADFDAKKYAPPNGQKLPALRRMRYDLDAFEKEAKLGPIIASSYFTSN